MDHHVQADGLSAPVVDSLLYQAEHDYAVADESTKSLFIALTQKMEIISISGDDELRELWLFAPRGPIEEFADYDECLAEGDVENRHEFETLWLDEYPEPLNWYRLVTLRYKEIYSVFVNRKLVLQLQPEVQEKYPYPKNELLNWLTAAVDQAIQMIKSGVYHAFVNSSLPYRHRIGKILRQDYWLIFPEEKKAWLADMDAGEMALFEDLMYKQPENHPDSRLPVMTSGLFFDTCKLGYTANQYEGAGNLPARALYQKHADGRDDGLLDLDEASAEAFRAWYFDRERRGGHPWEVCRGGNSTHISLYVSHDDQGWYFSLAGSSMWRSVETIKFYLALVEQGLPVYLFDGKAILAMLKGEDFIGIVPQGVFPRYCDSFFPGMKMLTFMNLPHEKTDQVIMAANWHPLDNVQITEGSFQSITLS
jgi:hypothetical protein